MRKTREMIFFLLLLPLSTIAQSYPHPYANFMHDGRQQATTARPTTKKPADVIVNVSNFVLLGVLKVLVHILGFFGFQLHVGTVAGKRSVEFKCPSVILDTMWTSAVIFGGKSDVKCLQRLVCEDPIRGEEKIRAARRILGFLKTWDSNFAIEKHEKILKNMEKSLAKGFSKEKCRFASCANELKLL